MYNLNSLTLKKILLISLGIMMILVFSLPLHAVETKFTIRIGHADPPGNRKDVMSRKFAEMVEKDLEGLVKFKQYPGGSLGTLTNQVEGLQVGTHDMTITINTLQRIVPELNVMDLPYLFKTRSSFERMIKGSTIGDELLKKLEAKGIIGLAWWENGFRSITTNVKPIKVPGDLKGLKIRTPPSPMRMKMFKLYGANPAPLSFSELFSALKQGVFDAQENPLTLIKGRKLYEVQKYISLSMHVYNPQILLMSKILWDKLPPNAQASIKRAAKRCGDIDRDMGEQLNKEAVEYLSKKVEINEIDFNAFKKASKPLYDSYEHQDLLKRILEVVQ